MQDIEVNVTLTGGSTYSSTLPSNSPLLHDLFVSLASSQQSDPQHPGLLMQLPLEGGEAACSFMSNSVVSIVTRPAVLIQPRPVQGIELERTAAPAAASHVCIEDFLTPEENRQLLDYAMANEPHFEGSSVVVDTGREQVIKYRKSRVFFGIKESSWPEVFINRLKLHLPHILATLGRNGFRFDSTEIQLTASNDGDYFKRHADVDKNHEAVASRVITFVYYLSKVPRPYSGGNLLIYGDSGTSAHPGGGDVSSIAPENNMLVVFPSDRWHEVDIVRCPSRAFPDSRFTVNGWLRSGAA